MPFYEITLTAQLTRKAVVRAESYTEAEAKAKADAQADVGAGPPVAMDWQVEIFHLLEDQEVVKLREQGVLI